MARPLARLLEAQTPDEVTWALPDALAFANRSLEMFEIQSQAILRSQRSQELLGQIQQELRAQRQSLESAEGRARLRSIAERLASLYAALQKQEQQEKIYSPFSQLDIFVRVGINVLNGELPPEVIVARIGEVATWLQGVRGDIARFEMIYQQKGPDLQRLDQALGALLQYRANPQKQSLEDSLKLLGSASTHLAAQLSEMDALARRSARFSQHLPVEEWGRSPGEVTWRRLLEAHQHYRRTLETWRSSLLAPFAQAALEAAEAAWQAARPARDKPVAELDAAFTRLQAACAAVEAGWQNADLEKLPELSRLRQLVGAAWQGLLPAAELAESLRECQLRAENLRQHRPDLADCLSEQIAALHEMQSFPQERDRNRLLAGWQRLEAALPPLLSALPKTEKAGLICPRCGSADQLRDARFCRNCQAQLPRLVSVAEEYTDVVGGDSPGEGGRLARLEALADQAQSGYLGLGELAEQLDQMLLEADHAREKFEGTVATRMNQNAGYDAYALHFAENLEQYVEGLLVMREFAGGAPRSQLLEGLEICRRAQQGLNQLQQAIKS